MIAHCFNFDKKNPDKTLDLIDRSMVSAELNGGKRVTKKDVLGNFGMYFDKFEGNELLLDNEKFMFFQIAWLKPYIKIDIFPRDYINSEKLDYFKKKYIPTKYKFNKDIKFGKKDFNTEIKIKNEKIGFTKDKTDYMNDGLDTLQLHPMYIHETKEIFPLKEIRFEGYEFKCPNNVDYYLKVLYGSNYMHFPEIIETHNIVPFIESQINSKHELEEKFEKDLEYLKKLNKNFNKKIDDKN